MERQRPQSPMPTRVLTWAVLLSLYLPLVVMLHHSLRFKNPDESYTWSLHWYQAVFADPELIASLIRSFFVALSTAVIATIFGAMTAYTIHKSNFYFKKYLESLTMVSLIIPELIFALSLLSWFAAMHLSLSLITVIIAHITFTIPFSYLMISARLKGLDPLLDEAAYDLGATEREVLFKVLLPILKPALLTSFLLCFLLSFDDFLITFFVNGSGQDTLPVKLYTHMKMGMSPRLDALSSLMLAISLLFIFIFLKLSAESSRRRT
jgi:spermidine/putrescine transport system permease protein